MTTTSKRGLISVGGRIQAELKAIARREQNSVSAVARRILAQGLSVSHPRNDGDNGTEAAVR